MPERKTDPLWEAMTTACGMEPPFTKTERGRANAALKELREIDATAADILTRARSYRQMYKNATLTPQALVANWSQLKPAPKPLAFTKTEQASELAEPGCEHGTPMCSACRQENIRKFKELTGGLFGPPTAEEKT